ncbi:MAG: tryptophan-rich sensory protein [Deltaproteobacteria bacterium]|nr:tryptophan-rich sensory protein [Deltaproteobacteria bacterium]
MAKRQAQKTDWPLLAAFILACELAGVLGGLATAGSVTTWYPTLVKPAFSPPNWVFAPVWTLLYAMMGIAAYLIYRKGMGKTAVRFALLVFALQLLINLKWSLIFFGLHSISGALLAILVLWALIALTIYKFYKIDKQAAYWMIPYLAWVSFAALLNAALWLLN